MTLRSPSRSVQWTRWLFGGALACCVYVVVFRCISPDALTNLTGVWQLRVLLPVLAAYSLFVYETRLGAPPAEEDTRQSADAGSSRQEVGENQAVPDAEEVSLPQTEETSRQLQDEGEAKECPRALAPGEAEYVRARTLPHRKIPTFTKDGLYLSLLGQSAKQNYAPAQVKLGEYAMRRAAWVEAYYWMKLAERNGERGQASARQIIRREWSRSGFPNQAMSASAIFPPDAVSIGYAWLCVDSGHQAAKAREFLNAHRRAAVG